MIGESFRLLLLQRTNSGSALLSSLFTQRTATSFHVWHSMQNHSRKLKGPGPVPSRLTLSELQMCIVCTKEE
jgi:hypothetical protein